MEFTIKYRLGAQEVRVEDNTFIVPEDKVQQQGMIEYIVNAWCLMTGNEPLYNA